MVLWRFKWSGVIFKIALTSGRKSRIVSSWKLETSATVTLSAVMVSTFAV